LIPLR